MRQLRTRSFIRGHVTPPMSPREDPLFHLTTSFLVSKIVAKSKNEKKQKLLNQDFY